MSDVPEDRSLALACLAFLDTSPEALASVAGEAGFDHVTLRVTGSSQQVPAEVGIDLRRVAAVRAALDDSGVGVLDVEVLRLVPDLDLDVVAGVVDAADALGASHLLVVNSGLGQAEATDTLGRVVDLARGSGVRPCLEPMLFTRCRTLADAVATAAPTGAGVLVDALHLARAGGGPSTVAEAVRTHGPGLFPYVQVCDARAATPVGDVALRDEAVTDRLLPGDGVLPLGALLGALPDRIPLAVESPTRPLAARPATVRASEAMRAVRDLLGPERVRG